MRAIFIVSPIIIEIWGKKKKTKGLDCIAKQAFGTFAVWTK